MSVDSSPANAKGRAKTKSEAAPAGGSDSMTSFAEGHPDPVLHFDGHGRLVYANPAATGMAKSCGRGSPGDLLPPEAAGFLHNTESLHRDRVRLETSLGGRTFSWLFFRGHPPGLVHCHVQDITERQQMEAQWRHAQKIESVGRLAAGIAHDFNNVLTVVQGHTGLLRSDPAGTPTMKESVQQIARAAERGSKLTTQLLAFSRRNVLQRQALDLNEVVTQISSLLNRTLGEDLTYQFSYASDLPKVNADPGLIEQVIMNLAANAREAMPKGGQLVLSTSKVDVDETYVQRHPADARPGRFVCLTVSDTGCGMDAATLGRIFEPFFTTNEPGQGRGLGLAAVYGIVKQHQGWIEVRSQPGQGSTFRVFLPPDRKEAEAAASLPDEALPGGTETILVVEDEPPVRWIVKEVLGKYGYHVLEAGNGVEALAQWHQNHANIAMLLTDMIMPVGLSGQDLAEKFSSQKPDLKVMYISGYSLQVAGRGLSVLDGLNFLQKPFDGARLALAVRQCLDA
jgi:signal transduction histidine kinase/ActR/RegA family two-component response regulator